VRSRCALPLLLAVLASGCGGSSGEQDGAGARTGPAPQLAPPRAAEPARAPVAERKPAGTVVRIGGPAEGLAVTDGVLAAARIDRPDLVLARVADGVVERRVRLPASPRHLQAADGAVLVPAEEANQLVTVPVTAAARERIGDAEAVTVEAGDHPHDAAALGGSSFTADEFGSTVTEIRGGRRVRSAPVDAQPGGIEAVGDALAIISVRAYTVELLDGETLQGGGAQSAGLGPTHVAADRAGRLYLTDTRGDALILYATRPRLKWLARIALPGTPYGIAVDDPRGRLLVTLTARNELAELTLGDRPRRTRTWPTVRQPNTVAVDPSTGRVAVASAAEDALQLLPPPER